MVGKVPVQGAKNRETNTVRAEVIHTGAKTYAQT
jgi:hypothetical protein